VYCPWEGPGYDEVSYRCASSAQMVQVMEMLDRIDERLATIQEHLFIDHDDDDERDEGGDDDEMSECVDDEDESDETDESDSDYREDESDDDESDDESDDEIEGGREFRIGQLVKYTDPNGKMLRLGRIMAIDSTHEPPSFTIKFEDSEEGSYRDTTGDRLDHF
jgi:hypothetical protein